ncbi:MAG: sigma-70 family RNA polymerase sigma factor [bacterium]|nr:sigma-70 family RNA polymerase sigma factor [bacterium]
MTKDDQQNGQRMPVQAVDHGSSTQGISGPSTSLRLLLRARQGRDSAVEQLFARLLPSVTRWARGRLPLWARARMDTDDLVQEAFGAVFRRIDKIEPRRRRAIRAYLKQAIRNRVLDEIRRAGKVEVPQEERVDRAANQTSPLEAAISAENIRRYRDALGRVSEADRELIVGRIELDYSYDQLALVTSKPTPSAARVAVRRALERLATEMELG